MCVGSRTILGFLQENDAMSTRITRRRVLQQAAAAGLAGWAIPKVIPSGVLARAGRVGANERIVLGGIGVRRMGGALIRRAFARFGSVRIAAVADVDLQLAEAIGQPLDRDAALIGDRYVPEQPGDLSGVVPYQDYRRLLDRQDIDAVVVATPEHWHALPSIQAAQSGKDVYCEKPISLTVHEGRLMVQAMRKYERIFQTGTQRRSQLEWYTACMLAQNGCLGKLQRVTAGNYSSPWDPPKLPAEEIPEKMDWDMWCGPVEPYPYHSSLITGSGGPTWRSHRIFAGGDVTNSGSHWFDLVQWGVGADDSGPVQVWTQGDPFDSRSGRGPQIFMRYANDVLLECNANAVPQFVGEKGSLTVRDGRLVADPPELADIPLEDLPIQLYRSTNHYQNWLDCIKDRQLAAADVEIGHRSATVCHLANISRWVSQRTGETGQRLEWDPQTERFTNSDLANEFLRRTSRSPYQLPETI
jgi:predicted dehydrogenase